MIKNVSINKILKNESFNNLFISASLNNLKENCNILKSNFYLDTFNYFPITSNYQTFHDLFKKQDVNSVEHFYTKNFYDNFKKNEINFKKFENCFVLGSSIADNYFSNLLHFLPRLFFTKEKKINLVIHRNLSNKFRELITLISKFQNVEIKFNYIDDEFYKFNNSSFPQFFDLKKSVSILKFFLEQILINIKNPGYGKKIYIRREDTYYRKILNEADLIEKLKTNGFTIVNPNLFDIVQQMKIFSNADLIVSPHGSNLSNIVFCKKDTKIVEISPRFENSSENYLSNRFKKLSAISQLKHSQIYSDSVDVINHSDLAKKYINTKMLNNSNYYKNLILKVSDIDKLINNL